jgi:hypothetical protein
MSSPDLNELARWVVQTATDAVRNDGIDKFDGDSERLVEHLWHNVAKPELERCGVDAETVKYFYQHQKV